MSSSLMREPPVGHIYKLHNVYYSKKTSIAGKYPSLAARKTYDQTYDQTHYLVKERGKKGGGFGEDKPVYPWLLSSFVTYFPIYIRRREWDAAMKGIITSSRCSFSCPGLVICPASSATHIIGNGNAGLRLVFGVAFLFSWRFGWLHGVAKGRCIGFET